MRKKYIRYLIVSVILFQISAPGFLQVHAEVNNTTKQPAVCAGPSETMSQYFQFQEAAINAINASDASNKNLTVSNGDGWLFSRRTLSLPNSALDFVVDNMRGRSSSIVSTTSTSIALLLLASKSVIESDMEGLAIFFKDRPIVRDYQQMLDIETEIFDTAFGFSRTIDLTRSLQGNTVESFKKVVDEYKSVGLLEEGANAVGSISMANILKDLTSMNAAMKYFMAVGGEEGASELRRFAGCLGQSDDCKNPVLKFNPVAIEKLKKEYEDVWEYGACNKYASNFKNTLSKAANNNGDTIKSAWNDIKISWNALKSALIGKGTWTKALTDPCQMTDYERALVEAYRGGTWTCGEGVSVSSVLSQIKGYENNKKAIASQGGKSENLTKEASSGTSPSRYNLVNDLNSQVKTEDKNLVWHRSFSGESLYNPEFSNSMNDEFVSIFDDVTEQFGHSQRAAMASDLTFELTKVKGLVDQVDEAMVKADQLRKDLQDIADYQCSM